MKQPISIEEHKQIGRSLYEANQLIIGAMRMCSGKRGVKSGLIDRYLRLDKYLQLMRSEMDTLMFLDHRTGVNTDVYYPRPPRDPHPSKDFSLQIQGG
jgi:hypothetical protein